MRSLFRSSAFVTSLRRCVLFTIIVFLPAPTILRADTPGMMRHGPHAGCYCKCDQGRTHAGCSRMCDASKRARWSANTCAKPRIQKPAESPGAGPHLPHPPRAERASN